MLPFRFYLITDGRSGEPGLPGQPGRREALLRLLPGLAHAGLGALQLREKALAPAALAGLGREVMAALGAGDVHGGHRTRLFVNDRADLALALGAAGVHLREDSLPLAAQPPLLRERLAYGVSTHSLEGVRAAEAAGAAFVTFGPVYDTPSKAGYGAPVGLEALGEACRACTVPVLALGGVTPERVRDCLAAGAHGVAAISAVWDAPDPVAALRAFGDALGGL